MKKKAESNVIKTIDQVQFTFPILLEKKQREELMNGVFKLIQKLENPEIDRLLEHYQDFVQKYVLQELLYGKIVVLNANRQDTQTASTMSCLLALISFSSELLDSENKVIPLTDIQEDHIAVEVI